MAHFAQLNEENVVINIIVVNNATINNLPFPESELVGIEFCKSLYGEDTVWKQTSYNNSFRKNYAGLNFKYYAEFDAFIAPKPPSNPSFILNTQTLQWEPPVPMPRDSVYTWDEEKLSWIEKPKPYESWTLELEPKPGWKAPVPIPEDAFPVTNKLYSWNENLQQWVYIEIERSV